MSPTASICPYCSTPVEAGAAVHCEHCATPHHAECWAENLGCAVAHCVGAPAMAYRLVTPGGDPARAGLKLARGDVLSAGPPQTSRRWPLLNRLVRARAYAVGWLLVRSGPCSGKQFILHDSPVTIGKEPKCDITIPNPDLGAVHCDLLQTRHRGGLRHTVSARDGSVEVNGQAVEQRRLRSGDVLRLGTSTLEYLLVRSR